MKSPRARTPRGATRVVRENKSATMNGTPYTRERRTALLVFFCLHYGMFTTVHGAFITIIFGPFDLTPLTYLMGVGALLISHAFSYRTNFIGKGEYKHTTETVLFIPRKYPVA